MSTLLTRDRVGRTFRSVFLDQPFQRPIREFTEQLSCKHEYDFDFATGVDECDVDDHERLWEECEVCREEGERVRWVVVYMGHLERREPHLRVQR